MGSLLFSFLSRHLRFTLPLLIPRPCLLSPSKVDYKLLKVPNTCYLSTKEGNTSFVRAKKDSKMYPRSVFAAGTAKRTSDFFKRKSGDELHQQPKNNKKAFNIDTPLTRAEWKNLKENSKSPHRFEITVINDMLNAGGDINVAKSLLAFVALETGSIPYELLLKYLAFCVKGSHHSEVFDVYDIMKSRFKALDTGAYSLFIKGFSRTQRWKEALPILDTISKVIVPSTRNYGDIIAGAAHHGDSVTAWTLYGEILDKGLTPRQDTWQTLFECSLSNPGNDERLQSILLYMRDNQIYPDESLAKSIKAWFERLESIQLSEEEYVQLKDMVMKDIIEGQDVFNKTTPEELEIFKTFVKRKPAFDVVIDGLNVANTITKGSPSEKLLAVVSELEQQGLSILVLGRKHMLHPSQRWDRYHMSLVQKKAHCFFTENISEDDPFLLYATLHSGNHCKFVSRDLMRDHKACLSNSATRHLFFKWQRGHQLVLNRFSPGKKICFQKVQSYDTIIQTDRTSWHIPYDEDGGDRSSYEVPQKWLCLTRVD
ncbi:hypothetical protein JZ751_002991 [Albula glossodonta]|uniref:Mitochondrial ribonuclease P catalytic subunit n=1 Tax=Albula glossodonta TaxID=121402 RepID=A0A8T2N9L6_9TELE|nr:hypothetical protein JZ751_002991 [Albula glossodonta]